MWKKDKCLVHVDHRTGRRFSRLEEYWEEQRLECRSGHSNHKSNNTVTSKFSKNLGGFMK